MDLKFYVNLIIFFFIEISNKVISWYFFDLVFKIVFDNSKRFFYYFYGVSFDSFRFNFSYLYLL